MVCTCVPSSFKSYVGTDFSFQPRTVEFFRFLGISEDAKRLGGPLLPVQVYKLPGGTEPVGSWMLLEKLPSSPDRPEVSGYLYGANIYNSPGA